MNAGYSRMARPLFSFMWCWEKGSGNLTIEFPSYRIWALLIGDDEEKRTANALWMT